MALGSACSPNGSQPILLSASRHHRKSDRQATDKEDIRGFTVIATVAAAVTFVTGFTCTKVYISSCPDLGITGLVKKAVFMVFMLCNSIPMLASVVAVTNFIWAKHLTDFPLIDKAFLLAVALSTIAFVSMLVAFMVGVFLLLILLPWNTYFRHALDSVFL